MPLMVNILLLSSTSSDLLGTDSFKVHLPWWRNRVDIYMDEEAKSEFVATIKLDRLGRRTNWQRRLRHNYTTLYVKGFKPEEPRSLSISALSETK